MKIGKKILAGPLLVSAMALVAGLVYGVVNHRNDVNARVADRQDRVQFKLVVGMREQVSRVRSEVFRTLSLVGSLDEVQVKKVRANLASQLDDVHQRVASLPASFGNDPLVTQMVADTLPHLKQYQVHGDKVMELARLDPNDRADAMRDAEASHLAMLAGLAAIVERKEARMTARADRADADALRLSLVLGGLMLLATGVALFIGFRMQRRLIGELDQVILTSQAVASGDLSVALHSDGDDEIASLMRAQGGMVRRLSMSMQTVRQATTQISAAASEIAYGNADLSQRTEVAAANLQQTASAMSQLTANVRQSVAAAAQANQLAASASSVAQRGGAVVAQVVATMGEINQSSKQIADITSTIDSIAFQTNILALNAAVEAARAGDQGRGFAAVASEVRSLAQRSADAARQIKALIGTSVDKVEAGTRLVQDAGSTMGDIVASVQRVSDVIAEVTAASGEQSAGIGRVNSALRDLDQSTQQNAALVEQSAAAAESLKEQALRLADVVGAFRLAQDASHTNSTTPLPAKAAKPWSAKSATTGAFTAPAAVAAAPFNRPGATAPFSARQAKPTAAAPSALARRTIERARDGARAPVTDDWETF